MKWLHHLSQAGWSLSNLAAMVRLNLFTYRDLKAWLDDPYQTPPQVPKAEQLALPLPGLGKPNNFSQIGDLISKPHPARPTGRIIARLWCLAQNVLDSNEKRLFDVSNGIKHVPEGCGDQVDHGDESRGVSVAPGPCHTTGTSNRNSTVTKAIFAKVKPSPQVIGKNTARKISTGFKSPRPEFRQRGEKLNLPRPWRLRQWWPWKTVRQTVPNKKGNRALRPGEFNREA